LQKALTVPNKSVMLSGGNTGIVSTFTRGEKLFELSNHLGNVMLTLTDKKLQHTSDNINVDYYVADVASASDYYPFGMQMPSRIITASTSYSYGFNGQENSTEIAPNTMTAEYWEYDSRIGRRWNLDPIVKTWESPYAALSNSPIWKLDPKGDDDIFNSDGTFSYRTKTGSNIRVITKAGIKLLSQIQPNNAMNIKTLVNIVGYYAGGVVPSGTMVGISPNVDNKKAYAYTNTEGINITAKNGIDPLLDNYNNLKSTIKHERSHQEAGDPTKPIYNFADHLSVYDKQIDDKTFKATDNVYKFAVAENYAGYLLGALDKEEIDDKTFDDKVNILNTKLKPYGISISAERSSASLPAVKVKGKNNNGKPVESKDFVKPLKDPH